MNDPSMDATPTQEPLRDDTPLPEAFPQETPPVETLSLAEAVNYCQLIVNGFRGFRHVYGVLEAAQGAQGRMVAVRQQVVALQTQLADQEARLQALTEQTQAAEQAHQVTLERLTQERHSAEQAHAETVRALAEERRQLDGAQVEAQRQHQATLAQYSRDEAEAQRKVTKAEQELEKLKRQTLQRLGMA